MYNMNIIEVGILNLYLNNNDYKYMHLIFNFIDTI